MIIPTQRLRLAAWGVSALLLTCVCGCAQPRGFGGYFADRGRDFVECFKFSGGYGWGAHARAEALIFGAGAGLARCSKYGWDGPGGAGDWRWRKVAASAWVPIAFSYNVDARGVDEGAPLGPFVKPRFGDTRPPDLPAELVYLRGQAVVTGYSWRRQRRTLPKGTRVADLYWIEVDATAMPVSLRAGFNPAEFLDWLVGWACLDMLGDDRHVVEEGESKDLRPEEDKDIDAP